MRAARFHRSIDVTEQRSDLPVRSQAVGLVPAAGLATRLRRPSDSKELLPVWRPNSSQDELARPAIHCLLAAFEAAGVERTVIVYRRGKEDIPDSLGAATRGGMRLEYVRVEETPSPPFTLNAAVPTVLGTQVLMGFPDILFEPPDSARQVLGRLQNIDGDVVLGLFRHPHVRRADHVEVASTGVVRSVRRGGTPVSGGWTWGLAAWRPSFTAFLQDFVGGTDPADPRASDLGLGDVIMSAIESGLSVQAKVVSDLPFHDIGTPDGLAEAYRKLRE
jgi:glucose-1-phosphate thymidylyltransferase